MLALVIAGELVFGLAFNIPRFIRPTMLEVFGITNTQLGDMFAIYGIAAMLAYFPGGALADHFTARSLMATSLFATALGGLYLATVPGDTAMRFLYGYWGVTTIFLFWGALIRATRDWGGDGMQGMAFGLLDGGRGLAAAIVASAAVAVLALVMPENVSSATPEEREAAFRMVVYLYSGMTFFAALLVWFAVPPTPRADGPRFNPLQGMAIVLRRPIVWAQAAIVVCAYCGYKGIDNYSLYAVQVLGMDEVEGARLASYGAWTRPVAAILAGLVADRFNAARSILAMFIGLTLVYFILSMITPEGQGLWLMYANFVMTYVFVYGLRGVYFALLADNKTPSFLTGAAVGLVSVVGFTPDIFFAPIGGRILDANPGIVGFHHYFLFLAAIAVAGILAVFWLLAIRKRRGDDLWRLDDVVQKKNA